MLAMLAVLAILLALAAMAIRGGYSLTLAIRWLGFDFRLTPGAFSNDHDAPAAERR